MSKVLKYYYKFSTQYELQLPAHVLGTCRYIVLPMIMIMMHEYAS